MNSRRPALHEINGDLETEIAALARPAPMVTTQRSPVPQYGEPQRDAINSVVDGIMQDISTKIDALRRRLDEIETRVRDGAADAKASLNEQIAICIRVNDEIKHMGEVIEELAARGRDE